jgi:hypothetical protein
MHRNKSETRVEDCCVHLATPTVHVVDPSPDSAAYPTDEVRPLSRSATKRGPARRFGTGLALHTVGACLLFTPRHVFSRKEFIPC